MPEGRRDALLLDHGLPVVQVAEFTVENLDLTAGRMTFYQRKVAEAQTHQLSSATLRAARVYPVYDALPAGLLLRGSRKSR